MNKKIILWFVLFVFCFNLVLALGIRPAKTEMFIEQMREMEGEFWIANMDSQELDVTIYGEGEMAQYLTIHTPTLHLRSDEEAKSVRFKISIPAGKEIPAGDSVATIVVEQIIEQLEQGVSSKIVLKHKVIIKGPYPEKYVETFLNFHEQGSEIELISEVRNKGKKSLGSVNTLFYVNDKMAQVHEVSTSSQALDKGGNALFKAKVARDLFDIGEYTVSAITTYDDQKVELIRKMKIGKPEIDVTYFDQYFIAHQINKYMLELFNHWNQKIESVFVNINVKKDGRVLDSFRTKATDLEGLERQRLSDYYDAREREPGRYNFELEINYWNMYKMETKVVNVELLDKGVADEKSLVGNAIASVKDVEKEGSFPWLVVMGIIVGIIVGFVGYKYKHREEYE